MLADIEVKNAKGKDKPYLDIPQNLLRSEGKVL